MFEVQIKIEIALFLRIFSALKHLLSQLRNDKRYRFECVMCICVCRKIFFLFLSCILLSLRNTNNDCKTRAIKSEMLVIQFHVRFLSHSKHHFVISQRTIYCRSKNKSKRSKRSDTQREYETEGESDRT